MGGMFPIRLTPSSCCGDGSSMLNRLTCILTGGGRALCRRMGSTRRIQKWVAGKRRFSSIKSASWSVPSRSSMQVTMTEMARGAGLTVARICSTASGTRSS